MDPTPHVAVVGGGITGLAAAYFLQELSRERGRPVAITLLEAGPRLGGKILTERVDGFCIEAGPDSFLARKPWARLLAERLGLGEELVTIDPRHRRTYIVRQGQLHPIPEGLFMFVPLRMDGLARSQLLSPAAKERMAMEPSIPPGPPGDESIADFVARRVGQEALEQLAEPLLTGIYAGRADRLSIMATFPQFKEAEQRAGSLVKGLGGGRAAGGPSREPAAGSGNSHRGEGAGGGLSGRAPGGPGSNGAGGSAFLALRGGLETLVDALVHHLTGVTVRTGVKVTALAAASGVAAGPAGPGAEPAGAGPDPAGTGPRYVLTLSDGTRLAAHAVIMTMPAFAAADLLAPLCPSAAAPLRAMRFVSVITCALGFDRADVQHPLDGTGFLVPRKEGRAITACTWVSSKWAHTAAPDRALIRCYLGRDGEEQVMALSDGAVVDLVRRELEELMGIDAAPRLVRVYRWERAMPQYEVGHLDRVAAVEQALASWPGLLVAGASYQGLGIPDCVRQGELAAQRALAACCP